MWKCKLCGSTEFEAVFHSIMSVDFDEEGDYDELFREERYVDTFRCGRCETEFRRIGEIADWVEEGEEE